eukprot:gnl/Chilomastix_cuspidata/183.p1 GENE.gnl/Chilomastix_cuspidata/183~~gnl/Chilomastix_cuspidata/183.p1  ORF type:complete len:1716 (+),score=619.69 gnl/Chilomastix_cuspidata/183:1001-6148(+)
MQQSAVHTEVAALLAYLSERDPLLKGVPIPRDWKDVDVKSLLIALRVRQKIKTYPMKFEHTTKALVSSNNPFPVEEANAPSLSIELDESQKESSTTEVRRSAQFSKPPLPPHADTNPYIATLSPAGAAPLKQSTYLPLHVFQKFSSFNVKLSTLLPARKERKLLALDHLFLISGLFLFPAQLATRPVRARTRQPSGASPSSGGAAARGGPDLPRRCIVRAVENTQSHFILSELRKSVPFTGQRTAREAAFLAGFVPLGALLDDGGETPTDIFPLEEEPVASPGADAFPDISKDLKASAAPGGADAFSGQSTLVERSMRMQVLENFNAPAAGSLSFLFHILCRVSARLGADLRDLRPLLTRLSENIPSIFKRWASVLVGSSRSLRLPPGGEIPSPDFPWARVGALAEDAEDAAAATPDGFWDRERDATVSLAVRSAALLCASLCELIGMWLVSQIDAGTGGLGDVSLPAVTVTKQAKELIFNYAKLVLSGYAEAGPEGAPAPFDILPLLEEGAAPTDRAGAIINPHLTHEDFSRALHAFICAASRVFATLDVLVQIAPGSAGFPQISLGGSQLRHVPLPPNVLSDLGFATFSLLRNESGYVFRLADNVHGLSALFQAAHECELGWGSLMTATVGAALYFSAEHDDNRIEKLRDTDLGVTASYAVLALNTFLAARSDLLESTVAAFPEHLSAADDAAAEQLAQPTQTAAQAVRVRLASKLIEFLEARLSDYRVNFSTRENSLDSLIEAIACASEVRVGRIRAPVMGTSRDPESEASSSANDLDAHAPARESSFAKRGGESFTRPMMQFGTICIDSRRRRHRAARDATVSLTLPGEWSSETLVTIQRCVEENARRICRKRFSGARALFASTDAVPEAKLLEKLSPDLRGKYLEWKQSQRPQDTPSSPAAHAAPAPDIPASSPRSPVSHDQLEAARKGVQTEAFCDAIKRLCGDIEVEHEIFLPKFSAFMRPRPGEHQFVPGTEILESSFTVYARAVAEEVDAFLDDTVLSWMSDLQLDNVRSIVVALLGYSRALNECLKKAQVFGLHTLEAMRLAGGAPTPPPAASPRETDGDLESTMRGVFPTMAPAKAKRSKDLPSEALPAAQRVKAQVDCTAIQKDTEQLILASPDDLEKALAAPKKSVIRLSAALGVRQPSAVCQTLLTIFIGEATGHLRRVLSRVVRDEHVVIGAMLENISDNEGVMNTLSRHKDSVSRFMSSIGSDFVAILDTYIVELTQTHSGYLPAGLGQTEGLPLSFHAVSMIASFLAQQLSLLVRQLRSVAAPVIEAPPAMTPLFSADALPTYAEALARIGARAGDDRSRGISSRRIKEFARGVGPRSSGARRPSEESEEPQLPQEDVNRIARHYGFTLPRGARPPTFARFPASAHRLLPFPRTVRADPTLTAIRLRDTVDTEEAMLRKVVITLIRLNTLDALEWFFLRIKRTVTEIARRVSAAEKAAGSVIGGLLDALAGPACRRARLVVGEAYAAQEGVNETSVETIFLHLRAEIGKARSHIISALSARVIFYDLRPLFQALYFASPTAVCFRDGLRDIILHVLQLTANTATPQLIAHIAQNLLFDLSTAMSIVILDTGPRARSFGPSSFDVLNADYNAVRVLFAGRRAVEGSEDGTKQNRGPLPLSFVDSNMSVYHHAVNCHSLARIKRYRGRPIARAALRECLYSVENPGQLREDSRFLRALNGWRYQDKQIRSFLQTLKRKAT